jgi:diguanylate cyclase (GGDEF)-like protein
MSRLGRWSLATLVCPVLMLVVGAASAVTIASLQNRSTTSRQTQIQIASLRYDVQAILNAAFSASPQAGGSPTLAHSRMATDEADISQDLRQLTGASSPRPLVGVQAQVEALYPVLDALFEIGAFGGGYGGPQAARVDQLQATAQTGTARLDERLMAASTVYERRATSAKAWAMAGAILAISVLLLVFAVFYFRSVSARRASEVLAAANRRLLRQSRHDALTDALTGLPNRRALVEDLADRLAGGSEKLILGLFDLDGFKGYNDKFGHVAGDALLARLGTKLGAAFTSVGKAYRIGGDEFCVLSWTDDAAVAATGVLALSESGVGWVIGSSAGTVSVREESRGAEEALDIADQRMYADKADRRDLRPVGAWYSSETDFAARAAQVEHLSRRTAVALGLDDDAVAVIGAAASMYNAGLRAVPSAIVDNPGDLDPDEWAFVRRYPIVGQRMVVNARLSDAAILVRSTQERADGEGYPDGLQGEEIPLGSRVIAVCSAFVAMTASRSYAPAMTVDEAMLELAGNAGTQFDKDVVTAFSGSMKTDPVL